MILSAFEELEKACPPHHSEDAMTLEEIQALIDRHNEPQGEIPHSIMRLLEKLLAVAQAAEAFFRPHENLESKAAAERAIYDALLAALRRPHAR